MNQRSQLRLHYRRHQWILRLSLLMVAVLLIGLRVGGCKQHGAMAPGEATSNASFPDDDFNRYNNRTFKVVKVLDGDTFDVAVPDPKATKPQAYTRIRLWGIDTPEISHGRSKPAMYYGYEAAEFARKLLNGKEVRLELIEGDTRCRYGRLLAYAFLPDGRMYNELTLREGFAYADTRFKHPRREAFIKLEAEARQNLIGLWQGVQPDQLPHWYKKARLESFWSARDSGKTIPAGVPIPKKQPSAIW